MQRLQQRRRQAPLTLNFLDLIIDERTKLRRGIQSRLNHYRHHALAKTMVLSARLVRQAAFRGPHARRLTDVVYTALFEQFGKPVGIHLWYR